MHWLELVLGILRWTLSPGLSITALMTAYGAGSTESSLNRFSIGFTDAGITSVTNLLTAFGEAGALPPPVFLLSLRCSSNSLFVCSFMRFQNPWTAFISRLFPSGFPALKLCPTFSHDDCFLFNMTFSYPLFLYLDIASRARQVKVFLIG